MKTKKTEPKTSTLSTANLDFAAFVMALGHNLHEVIRTPGERAQFVFTLRDTTATELKDSFFAGGTVAAQRYSNCIRDLKARLHA